jgi:hypothetical protein
MQKYKTENIKHRGDYLMKKSDIYYIEPNTHGSPLDRYFAYDFAQVTSDFLSINYEDSTHVSYKINEALYINICSAPAALFLNKAIKLQQNKGMLKMHMEDAEDMFYILMKNDKDSGLAEKDAQELINLASSAGFYININKSTGAIIAKCEIEKAAAAIVEAITAPSAFREYLEAAFEYED